LLDRKVLNMQFSPRTRLGLTLAGFALLTTATVQPAHAQNLLFTLSGVTFSDGATATGSFLFSLTSQTYGTYDITTTNGLTDKLTGDHYTPATIGPKAVCLSNSAFIFDGNNFTSFTNPYNNLGLGTSYVIKGPGIYSLELGSDVTPTSYSGSGESAPVGIGNRGVSAGSLIVTPAAAVPEASTTASLGILLALGAGAFAIARKKKVA